MRIEIKWGRSIHEDETITKNEIIHCDDEEEFWKKYEHEKNKWDRLTANVFYLTIQKKTYGTIEEYRNRNNGEEE